MAVQVQMQRPARTESAVRWEKALERALVAGLEVFQLADTGERMVTSASQLDTLHRTDGRSCTCAAGLAGDPVCQHRAVVRFIMGWLPEPSPAASAVALVLAPAPALPCLWCNGCGRVPNDVELRLDICRRCSGSGRRLAVQIVLPGALPPMTGDAERVRQILLNLAGNAVKFTQEGHVRISAAAAASGGVVVEVSDTGIGITAEALLHIFEAFHQVDSSLTRRHEGSGLGLAIAWKLVQQMGGSLSVSSEPDVGSIFRLHLPEGSP